ncbi:polyprotein [Hordeum vulgare alphaendornavirus]|uniref:Polyprotein n=1 Tax=Hordeum vulgare alphaendornavirus TaxID=1774276 RepID=A0A0U3E1L3_9VIRU|nr:polyprotein [Hordeum vulgare alphaendornavirus]ALT66307.1 polyprotein [Hordeum vulgare alphaendornavirus]
MNSQYDNMKNYYNQMTKVRILGRTMVPCALALQFPMSEPLVNNYMEASYIATYKLMYKNKESYEGLHPHELAAFIKGVRLNVEDSFNHAGNKLFYDSVEQEVSTHTIDTPNDPILWQAIREIEAKYGGAIGMQYQALRNCWTRVPHLAKVGGRHQLLMVDAEPCGHRRCAECGIMNGYWIPGEDGLSNAHCGACGTSLDFERQTPEPLDTPPTEDFQQINQPMGAFEMAQMEIIEQLDGVGDLEGVALKQAIENDERLIRAMISRANVKLSFVDPGMTPEQRKLVGSSFKNFILIDKVGPINEHAMIAAERQLMAQVMYDMAAGGQPIVDIGGPSPGWTAVKSYQTVSPILSIKDIKRFNNYDKMPVHCTHKLKECSCHTGQAPLIMSVDSLYDISPKDVMKFMLLAKSNYIVYCLSTATLDHSTNKGVLPWDQGLWIKHQGKLVTTFNGSSSTYENNWAQTLWWTKADVIIVGDHSLCIQTLKVCGNHILRVATICNDYKAQFFSLNKPVIMSSSSSVCMPIPVWKNPISHVVKNVVEWRTVAVEKEFLKLLLVRASAGQCSYDDLVKYAIGLGYSKYTLKDKVISMNYITADMALNHALIAKAITDRKLLESTYIMAHDKQFYDWHNMSQTDVLQTMGTLIFEITKHLLSKWSASDDKVQFVFNKVVDGISEWIADPAWYNLVEAITFDDITKMNIIRVNTSSPDTNEAIICDHHSDHCSHTVQLSPHYCQCCGLYPVVAGENRCGCCKSDHCHHKCHHKCTNRSEHLAGTKTTPRECTCCGVEYDTYVCVVCNRPDGYSVVTDAEVRKRVHEAELADKQRKSNLKQSKTQQSLEQEGDTGRGKSATKTHSADPDPSTANATNVAHAAPITEPTAPLADPSSDQRNTATPTVYDLLKLHMDDLIESSTPRLYSDVLSSSTAESTPQVNEQPTRQGRDPPAVETREPSINVVKPMMTMSINHPTDITTITDIEAGNVEGRLFLELVNLTSLEFAKIIADNERGWACVESETEVNHTKGLSQIKYVGRNITVTTPNNFEIVEITDVSGQGNQCGYNVINDTVGVDNDVWTSIISSRQMYSDMEVQQYCTMMNLNLLLLGRTNTFFHRPNTASDTFIVMRHCSLDSPEGTPKELWFKHWQRANVKVKFSRPWVPIFYPWLERAAWDRFMLDNRINEDFWQLATEQRLQLMVEFYTNNFVCSNLKEGYLAMLTMDLKACPPVIYNNSLMMDQPDTHLKGCVVSKQGAAKLPYALTQHQSIEQDSIMGAPINQQPPTNESELEVWLNNEIKLECIDYAYNMEHMMLLEEEMHFKEWQTVNVKFVGQRLRFSKGLFKKIKTGDIIMIKVAGYKMTTTVTISMRQVLCDKPYTGPTIDQALVGVNKQSHASKMAQVMTLLSKTLDAKHIWDKLKSATVIKGPGGSGKTTGLLREAHKGSIILTKTTMAKTNILKHNPPCPVMTLEAYHKKDDQHTKILIDEAGMFSLLDFATLRMQTNTQIIMSGDLFQIGQLITHVHPGIRDYQPCINFPANVTTLNSTYRYGKSVCDVLHTAGMNVTSLAPYDTTITLLDIKEIRLGTIKELVKKYTPDAVLTFYQSQKNLVESWQLDPDTHTVHEFQGNECDTVMVLQGPQATATTGIWNKPEYCISALTRARKHVVWVTFNATTGMNMVQRCGLSPELRATHNTTSLTQTWADMVEEDQTKEAMRGGGLNTDGLTIYVGRNTNHVTDLKSMTTIKNKTVVGDEELFVVLLQSDWLMGMVDENKYYLVAGQELATMKEPKNVTDWRRLLSDLTISEQAPSRLLQAASNFFSATMIFKNNMVHLSEDRAVLYVPDTQAKLTELEQKIRAKTKLVQITRTHKELKLHFLLTTVGTITITGRHRIEVFGNRALNYLTSHVDQVNDAQFKAWVAHLIDNFRCTACAAEMYIDPVALTEHLSNPNSDTQWTGCSRWSCENFKAPPSSEENSIEDVMDTESSSSEEEPDKEPANGGTLLGDEAATGQECEHESDEEYYDTIDTIHVNPTTVCTTPHNRSGQDDVNNEIVQLMSIAQPSGGQTAENQTATTSRTHQSSPPPNPQQQERTLNNLVVSTLHNNQPRRTSRERVMHLVEQYAQHTTGWIIFPRCISIRHMQTALLHGCPMHCRWTLQRNEMCNIFTLMAGLTRVLTIAFNRAGNVVGPMDGSVADDMYITLVTHAVDQWRLVASGQMELDEDLALEGLKFINQSRLSPIHVHRHDTIVIDDTEWPAWIGASVKEYEPFMTRPRYQQSVTHHAIKTMLPELPTEVCGCETKILDENKICATYPWLDTYLMTPDELASCISWIQFVQYRQIGGLKTHTVIDGTVVDSTTFGGCALCAGLKMTINEEITMLINSRSGPEPGTMWVNINHVIQYPHVISELCKILEMPGMIMHYPDLELYWSVRQLTEMDGMIQDFGQAMSLIERLRAGVDWVIERVTSFSLQWKCDQYNTVNSEYVTMLGKALLDAGVDPSLHCHAITHTGTLLVGLPTRWSASGQTIVISKFKGRFHCTSHALSITQRWEWQSASDMLVEAVKHRMLILFANKLSGRRELVRSILEDSVAINLEEVRRAMGAVKLNLSLDYHREHNTGVNAMLNDRKNKLVQGQLVGPHQAMYLSPNQIRMFGRDINRTCCTHNLTEHGTWLPDEGLFATAEQVAAKIISGWCGKNKLCTYSGTYSYIPLVNSSWNMKSVKPLRSTPLYSACALAMNGALNNLITSIKNLKDKAETVTGFALSDNEKALIAMCDKVATTKTNPWCSSESVSDGDKAMLGSEYLGLDWHSFCEQLVKTSARETFILVPEQDNHSGDYYNIHDRQEYFECQGVASTTLITLNPTTWSNLLIKHSMRYNNKIIHAEQLMSILGLRLVSIVVTSPTVSVPGHYSPCIPNNSNQVVYKINTPQLSWNTSVFSHHKTTVKVDTKMYRHLSFRVVSDTCSFEDLLSYARTYMQTTTYTQTGYYRENLDQINDLHLICACVYHEYQQKKTSWCTLAAKHCDLPTMDVGRVMTHLNTNLTHAAFKLMQAWKLNDGTLHDIKLASKDTIGPEMTDIIKNLATMNIEKKEVSRQIMVQNGDRALPDITTNCPCERQMTRSNDVVMPILGGLVNDGSLLTEFLAEELRSNSSYWCLIQSSTDGTNTAVQLGDGVRRSHNLSSVNLKKKRRCKHPGGEINLTEKYLQQRMEITANMSSTNDTQSRESTGPPITGTYSTPTMNRCKTSGHEPSVGNLQQPAASNNEDEGTTESTWRLMELSHVIIKRVSQAVTSRVGECRQNNCKARSKEIKRLLKDLASAVCHKCNTWAEEHFATSKGHEESGATEPLNRTTTPEPTPGSTRPTGGERVWVLMSPTQRVGIVMQELNQAHPHAELSQLRTVTSDKSHDNDNMDSAIRAKADQLTELMESGFLSEFDRANTISSCDDNILECEEPTTFVKKQWQQCNVDCVITEESHTQSDLEEPQLTTGASEPTSSEAQSHNDKNAYARMCDKTHKLLCDTTANNAGLMEDYIESTTLEWLTEEARQANRTCWCHVTMPECLQELVGIDACHVVVKPYAHITGVATRSKEIYNPNTEGNCVVNSLNYLEQRHPRVDKVMERACGVYGKTMWLTESDAAAISWLCNLETRYKHNQTVHELATGTSAAPLCINRVAGDAVDHCTVHNTTVSHRSEKPMQISILSRATTIEIEQNMCTHLDIQVGLTELLHDLNELVNFQGVDEFVAKYRSSFSTQRELEANLRLTGQVHTIRTKSTPIIPGEWVNCARLKYFKNTSDKLKPGECVLWTDGVHMHWAAVISSNRHGQYVWTPCPMTTAVPVVLRISMKWAKPAPQSPIATNTILGEIQHVTALNEATARHMVSHKLVVGKPTINNPHATVLVVADFDNRKHHKFDDRTVLRSWNRENIVVINKCPGRVPTEVFFEDSDMMTAVLYQGDPEIHIVTDHTSTAHWVKSFLMRNKTRSTVKRNVVVISDSWHTLQEKKTQERLQPHVHKINDMWHLNKLVPGTFTIGTEQELCQLLQITEPDLSVTGLLANLPLQLTIHTAFHEPLMHTSYHRSQLIMVRNDKYVRSGFVNKIQIKAAQRGGSWMEIPAGTTAGKWWDQEQDAHQLPNIDVSIGKVEAMVGAAITNIPSTQNRTSTHEGKTAIIPWMDYPMYVDTSIADTPALELVPAQIMDMWDTTDLSGYLDRFAPENQFSIKVKTVPTKLAQSIKSTLVKYPIYSRPVYTKMANQEFNAVTGRLGKVTQYRVGDYCAISEANGIANTFFQKDWKHVVAEYQSNTITYNTDKVKEWLQGRPNVESIVGEVNNILTEGFMKHPINKLNVHLKLESLLKSQPVVDHRQTKARILVWQAKGMCAIYSPVFKMAKDRLKSLLNTKTVYADGLRPDQLALRVMQADPANYIMENDLEQQDRQTDDKLLDVEMAIYHMLGVQEELLSLWRQCHNNWNFKGRSCRGERNWMRLTGQATTALGNAITNLCVHWRLCSKLGNDWKLFVLLGDDGALLTNRTLSNKEVKTHGKLLYNMIMKPNTHNNVGTFCCFNIYKLPTNRWTMGPDIARLRRRFEVTNGASEATLVNHHARCMSYCCMLGSILPIQQLIKERGYTVEPPMWYDWNSNARATEDKYHWLPGKSDTELRMLLDMMRQTNYIDHKLLHWVEATR